MRISSRGLLCAFASLAFVIAAGCSRRSDTQVDSAAGTVANNVAVTEIDLGRSIGADKHVTEAASEFRPDDTIYAVVSTSGSSTAATLQARWTFQDGQIVDESSKTIAPTGPAVTEFQISKPGGFPKGKYKVEILLNGTSTRSREFTVN
jgi:hypothetical protein